MLQNIVLLKVFKGFLEPGCEHNVSLACWKMIVSFLIVSFMMVSFLKMIVPFVILSFLIVSFVIPSFLIVSLGK